MDQDKLPEEVERTKGPRVNTQEEGIPPDPPAPPPPPAPKPPKPGPDPE
jgi:hypothetical protein